MTVLRWALVVLAATQLGQAADLLGSRSHAEAELAAWHAAAAVGLLTGAARPRLIDALMPLMAGATGVTVLVSVRDLVTGRTTPSAEVAHLILVLGFALLTILWAAVEGSGDRASAGNSALSAASGRVAGVSVST